MLLNYTLAVVAKKTPGMDTPDEKWMANNLI